MAFKLYTNSHSTWTAMLDAVRTAKQSIYLEMYIFSDDTKETHDFVETLCAKSREGVRIVMILDAIGSMKLERSVIEKMEKTGIEIIFFRHWLHRTHRKLLIIDSARAFVGGVNIDRSSYLWNDLQLEIRGRSVEHLVAVFARTYALAGGAGSIPTKHKKKKQRIRSWILEHTPASRKSVLRKYYEYKILHAQKEVVCITPYFVPHIWFVRAVEKVIKNNVDVKIIIPEVSNHWFMNKINMHFAEIVSSRGAKVFLLKSMNHAKALIIDRKEVMIGSSNLDMLSFNHNSELGLVVRDHVITEKVLHAIREWKKDAIPFSPVVHKLTYFDRVLVFFIRIFTPLI